jgi:hypothetical protein
MNKLIKQFPDGTVRKKDRVMWVDESNNTEFAKKFWTGFRDAVLIGFLFALGLVLATIMWLGGNGNAD